MKAALACELPVIGDELRMRHGVAIQEYQVIAPRPGDGLVENARAAEALVRLPDVFGAQGCCAADHWAKTDRTASPEPSSASRTSSGREVCLATAASTRPR